MSEVAVYDGDLWKLLKHPELTSYCSRHRVIYVNRPGDPEWYLGCGKCREESKRGVEERSSSPGP